MTDRELLELAAKAAGIELQDYCTKVAICYYDRATASPWNPLDRDGDALRLAVMLGLHLDFGSHESSPPYVCAHCHGIEMVRSPVSAVEDLYESDHEDWNAATRRAIVRAAAAIGEQKP